MTSKPGKVSLRARRAKQSRFLKADRFAGLQPSRDDKPGKIKTIAVIGLGLMGGSLAAAMKKKMRGVRVIGISRNRVALKKARQKGWIDEGTHDLAQGVGNADLIVLCTPVDTFARYFRELNRWARPDVLVTDVGSVKTEILKQFSKKRFPKLNYVSAHPMVGSHACGIEAVNPALYDRGLVFVIRDGAAPEAFRRIQRFWQTLMPQVVPVTAADHDLWTAAISHVPHAAAVCLMLATRPKAVRYGASGFRDMTRLAAGSPDIWMPIFQANRRNTLAGLKALSQQIRRFETALKSNRSNDLGSMLRQAARLRDQL